MSSFGQDEKWIEAKRAVGINNSWLEIINFYRSIGGENVFVYSAGNGDKRLIVDIIDEEDNILLLDKDNHPVSDTYENVNKSKKVFHYEEDYDYMYITYEGHIHTIPVRNVT